MMFMSSSVNVVRGQLLGGQLSSSILWRQGLCAPGLSAHSLWEQFALVIFLPTYLMAFLTWVPRVKLTLVGLHNKCFLCMCEPSYWLMKEFLSLSLCVYVVCAHEEQKRKECFLQVFSVISYFYLKIGTVGLERWVSG